VTAKPITFTLPNAWLNSTAMHVSVWDSATGGNRIDLDEYIDSMTVNEPEMSEFDDDIADMQDADGTGAKIWTWLNGDYPNISVKLYTPGADASS
jgi:hypothetical protein